MGGIVVRIDVDRAAFGAVKEMCVDYRFVLVVPQARDQPARRRTRRYKRRLDVLVELSTVLVGTIAI